MAVTEVQLHASSNWVREQTGTAIKAERDDGDDTDHEQRLWFEYVMNPEVGITAHPPPKAKICKVDPKVLRDTSNFKEHFHPRRVSVGPYHHFTDDHQLEQIKNLKPQWAKRFIEDSKQTIGILYHKIYQEISQLKQCYLDIAEYEDEHGFDYRYNYDCDCDTGLARMMVLDGCSVLCFIHYTTMGLVPAGKSTSLSGSGTSFTGIGQRHKGYHYEGIKVIIMKAIEALISSITYLEQPPEQDHGDHQLPHLHLLDLLRTRLLFGAGGRTGTAAAADIKQNNGGGGGDGSEGDFLYYRNIKGLKAARIWIKPSKTKKLTDVSFISCGINGYLHLPPLTIDHSTVTLLWNLIAYEICATVATDSGVTSYVTFLDSLIDYSEDVEELESARVLQNSLGSSLEVARFFNSISANLAARYVGFDPRVIADITAHIARHDSDRRFIWTSQLLDSYFSSPWKFIALVAVILVIILTSVQTYFAVFPR